MPNPENLEPHKMKPGETRNPKGRPPGKSVTTILKELLQMNAPSDIASAKKVREFLGRSQVTNAEAIAATLLYKALLQTDMRAITEIMDRIEGKPLQRNEHTGADGQPLFDAADARKKLEEKLLKLKDE